VQPERRLKSSGTRKLKVAANDDIRKRNRSKANPREDELQGMINGLVGKIREKKKGKKKHGHLAGYEKHG